MRPAVLGEDPHGALGVVQHLGAVLGGQPGQRTPSRRPRPAGTGRTRRPLPRRRRARPRRPSRCRAPRCRPWPRRASACRARRASRPARPWPSTVAVQLHARAAAGVASASSAPGSTASSRSRSEGFRISRVSRTIARAVRSYGGALQVGDRLGQLDVTHHLGEAAVELDGLQVVAEVLPGLALDLVDALDQLRERTELVDPLRGRLLADAGDARQVVGRVAAQGGEVGVLRGRQPVLLDDLLRGEPGQLGDALGRIQHRRVLGDQLEGVAVAGDDQHLEALGLGLGGERGDDVVGLEAVDREALTRASRRAARRSARPGP